MENKYTCFKNKNMHYTVQGSGNAVILIHGLMEGAWIWAEMTQYWAKSNKIVSIDLPGHGESEQIGEIHSMELCAELVVEIMHKENLEKAAIIGHSMGGYVALAVADLFPGKVLGLGLFHSQAAQDSEEGLFDRRRVIALLESNGQEKKGFLTRFIPSLFAIQNRDRLKDKIEALTKHGMEMSADSIMAIQKGLAERKSYLDTLQQTTNKTKIPFLFVIGKYDQKASVSAVIAQAMMCEKSEILWLPCGHMGFWEESETCASFVGDFLKRIFAQFKVV